jgi:outer membrane protein
MKKKYFFIITFLICNFFTYSACLAQNLSELYKIALDYDPVVASEKELLLAEQAYLKQAKAGRMPNVTFDASYTAARYEKNSSSYNYFTGEYTNTIVDEDQSSYNYNFTLEQPVYDRETSKKILYAKKRVEYQLARLQKSEQDLALKLSEAYCNYLIAKANLMLSEAEKESYHTQWKKLEDSLLLGLSTKMDTLEANVQYELAFADVIAKKNDLAAAVTNLEKITGVVIDGVHPMSLDEIKSRRISIYIEDWLKNAVVHNFDVIIARKNVAVAEENLGITRARYFPKLSLVGRYSDTDSLDTTIGGEDMRVMVRFNLPLYSGGRLSSGVEEAFKRVESYKEQERDAVRKTELSVVDTYNKLESSRHQVDAYINALKSAELYLEAAEEGYKLRLKSLTDLLEARSKVFKIKKELVTYGYNEYLSLLRLRALAGEQLEF